jgi:hypothetical protein
MLLHQILTTTSMSYVVSPCTYDLSLIIFVLCSVTIHVHGIPPMIFVLFIIPHFSPRIPPVIFVFHVITLHALYPPLETFFHHVRITCVVQCQTWEVLASLF